MLTSHLYAYFIIGFDQLWMGLDLLFITFLLPDQPHAWDVVSNSPESYLPIRNKDHIKHQNCMLSPNRYTVNSYATYIRLGNHPMHQFPLGVGDFFV